MLSGTWRTPEALRALIAETQALTARPFGVNLVLAWDMSERLELCLELGVPYLSFFWGTPPRSFLDRCHRVGVRVFHTVGSADEARAALDIGVDILVAQGIEAGGHVWGTTPLSELLPAVVAVAEGRPVAAAGGIGSSEDVRRVRAQGARAAWCGTRFLLAKEAAVHPRYRERIVAASASDTRLTTCFSGGWPDAPHRVLVNETLLSWERGERPPETRVVARYDDGEPIPLYSSNLPGPGVVGEIDAMCLYAGMSVSHARRVQPAAQIVAELSATVE